MMYAKICTNQVSVNFLFNGVVIKGFLLVLKICTSDDNSVSNFFIHKLKTHKG